MSIKDVEFHEQHEALLEAVEAMEHFSKCAAAYVKTIKNKTTKLEFKKKITMQEKQLMTACTKMATEIEASAKRISRPMRQYKKLAPKTDLQEVEVPDAKLITDNTIKVVN